LKLASSSMTDKIDKECAVMIRFNALTLLNE